MNLKSIGLGVCLCLLNGSSLWAATKDKQDKKEDKQAQTGSNSEGSSALTDMWGMRGGATLGSGQGLRASLHSGIEDSSLGYGYVGAEVVYMKALGRNMDIGVGARVPLYPFGITPGVEFRYRALVSEKFHLSMNANLYLPLTFAPVVLFGLSIEPGIMMSYFAMKELEIFWGLQTPIHPILASSYYSSYWRGASYDYWLNAYGRGYAWYSPIYLGASAPLFAMSFDLRAGAAYTFKGKNIGVWANVDVIPGFFIKTIDTLSVTGALFSFMVQGGVQWKF